MEFADNQIRQLQELDAAFEEQSDKQDYQSFLQQSKRRKITFTEESLLRDLKNEIDFAKKKKEEIDDITNWFRFNYKQSGVLNFAENFPKAVLWIFIGQLTPRNFNALACTCKYWNRKCRQYKNAVARNNVAYEILTSEREYVNNLGMLISVSCKEK